MRSSLKLVLWFGTLPAVSPCMHQPLSSSHSAQVAEHIPLVRAIVRSISDRLPNSVDTEALISAGFIGLMQAVEGFDPSKGVPFEAYARIRIRGATHDELRSLDHLSRRQRRQVRLVTESREALKRQGKSASDSDVAAHANLTEVQVAESGTLPGAPQPMDPCLLGEIDVPDAWARPSTPDELLLAKERAEQLSGMLEKLPDRQQKILAMYYIEDMNLREIGDTLNLTQSRVSQIISQAKKTLRQGMQSYEAAA